YLYTSASAELVPYSLFLQRLCVSCRLLSFPTRRSSDLSDIDLMFLYGRDGETSGGSQGTTTNAEYFARLAQAVLKLITEVTPEGDRKSTRLNSSHVATSYAVFCLKKKTRVRRRGSVVGR